MKTPTRSRKSVHQKLSHLKRGKFINPFSGFEDKTLKDFVRWYYKERGTYSKERRNRYKAIETYPNDGVLLRENKKKFSVTWVAHSTVLVQMNGMNILTDPIWSGRSSPVQFAGPKRYTLPAIEIKSLPLIHAVVISHDHYDHLDEKSILQLGNTPKYFVPLKVGRILKKMGITNYIELDWNEQYLYNGINFICTPAQHFSGRGLFDRYKTLWAGWALKSVRKESFYYPGDTGYFNEFTEIGDDYGPFDVVAAPIGAYKPEWFMRPVHMSPGEALMAFDRVKGKIFIPIHYGSFPLADDTPELAINDLKEAIKLQDINPKSVQILAPGKTLWIS